MYRNKFLDYIDGHPELKREKAIEIALGLQYLHTRNSPVVHGDIRPVWADLLQSNILISDSGAAQLNNFGTSRILDVPSFTMKTMRNMRYTAPELLLLDEAPQDPRPTTQSDIFSLAMLLLVVSGLPNLSCGNFYSPKMQLFNHRPNMEMQASLPYNHIRLVNDNGGHEIKLLRRIHAGERPIRERYLTIEDDRIWSILTMCWQPHPMQRPQISQVVSMLMS
ncbi:hypothetical protein HWV62_21110 [Athelia sp. TMB]|nr:hypothetical protein HWV62_21110 [Athelia sp. TMB]